MYKDDLTSFIPPGVVLIYKLFILYNSKSVAGQPVFILLIHHKDTGMSLGNNLSVLWWKSSNVLLLMKKPNCPLLLQLAI